MSAEERYTADTSVQDASPRRPPYAKGSVKLPLPPAVQEEMAHDSVSSLSRRKTSKWDHEDHAAPTSYDASPSATATSSAVSLDRMQPAHVPETMPESHEGTQLGEDEDGFSDESDDEADFDREISEAMKETDQLAKQSQFRQSTSAWWLRQMKWAAIKIVLSGVFISVLFAVNEGCKARSDDHQCTLETAVNANGTVIGTLQFSHFTWWISISTIAYLLGTFAIFGIFSVLRSLPIMGKAFSYYLHQLDRPLIWLLTAIVMMVTFNNPLVPVTFYNYLQVQSSSDASTFVRVFPNLVWCILTTGLVFVGKALLMRLFAILFHRGAYIKRIRQSLLSEKVLVDLMKGHRSEQRQKQKKKMLVKMAKGVTGAFSTKWLFDSVPHRTEELLNESAVKNFTLASWIEYIKFSEMMLYTANDDEETSTVGPAHRPIGRRNALVSTAPTATGSDNAFTITPLRLERQPTSFQKRFKRQEVQSQNETAVRRLAARLFKALLRDPSATQIYPEDFLRFFEDDMAEAAFNLFDRDLSGTIKERELYCSLLGIIRERFLLRTAIFDAEQALRKLEMAMTGLAMFALFVICLMIYRGEVVSVLTMVASVLVALTFAIGNSVKTLFESLLFLFATHPYDIGDRVIVDKEVYTVSKLNLLNTELKRPDNGLVYFSNSLMALKPILNLRRSPDMIDWISLQVDAFTSSYKLRELETRLAAWLQKRPVHYGAQLESEFSEIEDLNKLTIRFWIQHRGNFSNRKRYRERRSRVLLRIRRLCEQLDISYGLPPQEVRTTGSSGDMLETNDVAFAASRSQRWYQQQRQQRASDQAEVPSDEAAQLVSSNQQTAAAAGTVAALYRIIK